MFDVNDKILHKRDLRQKSTKKDFKIGEYPPCKESSSVMLAVLLSSTVVCNNRSF